MKASKQKTPCLRSLRIPCGHSRRTFLGRALGLTGLACGLPLLTRARAATGPFPIEHILICCNENHSFDNYYGYAPFVGSYGVPANYSQPNGRGGFVPPHHISSPIVTDPAHDWVSIHAEWDNGNMDGFYTTDGRVSVGYYDQSDLPFYYGLFSDFTLCTNYFCSLLGPTFPNRLYLAGGTSGGNTTNSIAAGSLTYPIILDLLDSYGITWKVYNIGGSCSVEGVVCDNMFQFFQNWWQDPRVINYTEIDYLSDLKRENLPQVSFVMTLDVNAEHPPFPIDIGQSTQQRLISALMQSQYWASSAYLLTYDEGGGFFDHVVPPVFDAYGAGIRVPIWVISPFAKKGHLEPTLYEHSSILKFVETILGLPTMASINHQFESQTTGVNNDAANGQPFGPPAPPRDGLSSIGDMTECFDFA